jgi:isoleucyl-tRNA synthetase
MGHTLDEKGKKMSKSKGNVIFTEDVISKYGADAVRWFLFSYPTWNSIRVDANQIYETMKKFILTLWNSYSFFVSNSNVDQFDKEAFFVPLKERPELDKWLISEVNYLIEAVNEALENMTVHIAVEAFEKFVIDKFSNWYLRQSRRRFWKDELNSDKKSAYITTYEVLAIMSKILAPFIPFISEQLFQNLVKRLNPDEPESIHLCMYPTFNKKQTDSELSIDMNAVLSLVTTGRSIRSSSNIKLRQPLSELVIIAPIGKEKLIEKYNNVLKEELNVKKVTLKETSDELVKYQITPNFKVLAPKVKSEINKIGTHLSQLDPQIASDYVKLLSENKDFYLKVDDKKYTLTREDVNYKIEVLEGFTGEESEGYLLLFNTTITEELKREGYVRDVVRRIQTMRKELDLEYTQNIQLTIKTDEFGTDAIEEFRDFIMSETLSTELREEQPTEGHVKEWEFDGYKISIGIVPI